MHQLMAFPPLTVFLIYILFDPMRVEGSNEPDYVRFSEEDKKAFVEIHNWLRESAAPSSPNMNYITWDTNLERLAQEAANLCHGDHMYDGEYKGKGENIYSGFRLDPVGITMAWYTEKSAYDHDRKICTGRQCGHYTEVMGYAVKTFGCGRRGDCQVKNEEGKISYKKLTYCEYSSGTGSAIYNYGAPCSACPGNRTFCLNNLCISSDLATTVLKNSPKIATETQCKLQCKNCGKRDAAPSCQCNCGADKAVGSVCQNKKPDSSATCSACTETTACLNGGVEDKSDPLKCKCTCKAGYVGDRCEMAKDVSDNSIKLALSTDQFYTVDGNTAMLPVSRTLFNSKLWSSLQDQLSKTINTFCQKEAASFVQCCPGQTFPADASSKSHVTAGDLKFTESSFINILDGSLYFLLHAEVTNSKLCSPGGDSRLKRAATSYVPKSVLISALEPSLKDIAVKVFICCNSTVTTTLKFAPENNKSDQLKAMPVCVAAMSIAIFTFLRMLVF